MMRLDSYIHRSENLSLTMTIDLKFYIIIPYALRYALCAMRFYGTGR